MTSPRSNPSTNFPVLGPPEACLALLKHLEFADAESIETGPLREYAVMALQDLEVEEAAYALLDFAFGDELTKGKKQNIAEDMQREPLWDKYPDLAYKEPIFNLQRLLNLAFDQTPKPEVHRLQATLAPADQAAEAPLTRAAFPEAEHIVWHRQSKLGAKNDKGRQSYALTLFSPRRWTNDLADASETLCGPYLDTESADD